MQKARRHPSICGTPTACKRTVSGSISPRYSRYFSPFPHGTCSLSVSQEYLALPDGAGRFNGSFTGSRLLRILISPFAYLYGTFTLFCAASHLLPVYSIQLYESYNPSLAVTKLVWANPRSLATTCGIIIIFSSSGYLDVSVPRVCSISGNITSLYWVAPFGNLRINSYLQIPTAYRSLSRPSSPLRAKAFPVRPFLLL